VVLLSLHLLLMPDGLLCDAIKASQASRCASSELNSCSSPSSLDLRV
jgi:hypothetical protein